ncbi:hypothetical protein BK129_30835, partial [Paenibacillus amylolyticus]|uniref:non-ribosomal peptide synthetase n=2 Tax=Paenibacillus TaxID=44249 RepID=UPI00097A9EB7
MSKKQGIKTIYPLSPLQEGIVFHTLYDQNPKVYFEQISFAVVGDFDHQLFIEAYKALCDRHDILRTIIAHEKLSKPMQVVLHSLEFDIYEKDISDLCDEECEEFVESYKENDINKGFQMVGIALHRLALFTQQGKFHVVWSHHHSLLDGWSVELLLKEWFQIYWAKVEGGNALLGKPEPFRSYVDWLEKQDKNGAADYWEKFTAGYEEKASLPFRKMSSEREGSHFKRIDFAFNEEVTSQLKDLSRTTGVTLNTVIQTLWGILLQKYSGHEDVIFGTVVSGRPASVIDIEKMVGLFINTIPVRISAERDASLPEVMRLIQEGSLESEAYNFFPLYEIQALSSLKQDLMDHVLVFENYPNRFNWEGINDDEHGFHIEGVSRFEETNFSFGLIVHPSDRLEFSILYDTLKYESDGIENIPNHMLCLVESMLDSPNGKISEYEIVPQSELKQLENYMGENEWFDRDVTIQELFEKQVEKAPDQIALITGDISWTYFELNRKANCIAHHLRHDIGIKPGMLVGIMTDRSSEMIAGILGIWKAGGAYLPLDPDYPEDRLSYIISDSGVEWVLSQTNMKNLLQSLGVNGLYLDEATFQKQEITFENLSVVNQPDDLAYIIYTSGSTGRPKGVMVEHRGVSNLSEAFKKELQIVQNDRILLFASISFDASVLELAESILQGATLCIPNNETIHDPWEMTQWMTTHQVTIATFPPGFAVYLDVEQMPYLRVLITAGSSSSMNLVEKFKSIRYINAYGPTEYTVCSALWNFNSDEMLDKNVPIGKPIANTEIFIMNRWGQQQPIGVVGELCIAGVGLAQGYLNRSDLTAEKFVEHPYKPEERMYKTGDLARWLPNGNLEYFGRVDHQVKIRGFRIEIGEIESAMQRLSGVQDAVVLARNDKEGQLYLVAYVVMGTETTSMDVNMIRSGLKKELPDFMVPERFIALEKLPFTPNGKVDRKALPEPKDGMTSGRAYAAPRDEWETKMVQVWQDVLVRERISIYDHFFELGGHSLKAMALVSALQKQLQIEMPLR